MASFTERVQVLIDVVTKGAQQDLASLKGKVSETEGSFGKAKVAAGGFGDFVKSNMGAAVAGGVAGAAAAIGTFAVKAGGDFQELALKVDNFKQKTGVSADAASRWIEVAGDLGVEADTVATAFGRFERENAAGALDAYGLSATNTSDRFAELLDKIGKIPDENERAAAAFKVFGKSWQSLAPLLDGTEQIADRLKDVQSGQLISDKQISEARDFRDDLDNLNDALRGFTVWVGEKAVAAVDSLIKTAEKIGSPIAEANDKIQALDDSSGGLLSTVGDFGGTIANEWLNPMTQAGHVADGVAASVDALTSGFGLWGDSSDDVEKSITTLTGTLHSAQTATGDFEKVTQDFSGTIRSAQVDETEYKDAVDAATDAAKRNNAAIAAQTAQVEANRRAVEAQTNAALASFNSELALHDAVTNLSGVMKDHKSTTDQVREALLQAAAAGAQYTQDQAEAAGATFNASDKANAMRNSLELLRGQFPGLNALIDEYVGRLNAIPKTITTVVTVKTPQGQGYKVGPDGRVFLEQGGWVPYDTAATGGPRRGAVLVGEQGPELVDLPGGSFVHTAQQTAGMLGGSSRSGGGGGGNVIINAPAGVTADHLVNMLVQYCRRNGSLPSGIRVR